MFKKNSLSMNWNINRFRIDYLSSFSTLSSTVKLNSKMKQLIDSHRYEQVLDLFHKQSEISTDKTIVLALKASTKLRNSQFCIQVHQNLSANSQNNPLIQTSLITCYSYDIDKRI